MFSDAICFIRELELAEITELYNNLKNDTTKQSEQLAAQSEKLSALDDKNKQVEDDLKTYIERSEQLKREAESDLLAGSKLRELEATIAQKDERIKFLESNWNMHKNDYNVYTEVKNNVSVILAEANKKAEDTVKEASEKAKNIIESANADREKTVTELKQRLSDLKLAVQNIETSVDIASSELERTQAQKSKIPDDILQLLKINSD